MFRLEKSILAVLLAMGAFAKTVAAQEQLNYVDTRIGTDEWQKESTLSVVEKPRGHVHPGVGATFAMSQFTAQTNLSDRPYFYYNPTIQGIRCTHFPNGAGMSEYGAFTIMPTTGELKILPEERGSSYSHDGEIAKPHYYSVKLDDYGIRMEITATSRAGYLRFTYPESQQAHIVIDDPRSRKGAYFKVNPESNEVEGFITNEGRAGNRGYVGREFASYFVMRFSRPFSSFGIVPCEEEPIADGDDAALIRRYVHLTDFSAESLQAMAKAGTMAQALHLDFATSEGEQVEVKVGTSFINIQQARANLDREIGNKDFETVMKCTEDEWAKALGKISVEASDNTKTIFYTALHHCLLLPREFSEDGYHYSAFNGKIMPGVMYTDYSLWDTFRSEHPLLVLLEPERNCEMIQGLLNSYDEGGWMPKWPSPGYSNIMTGTHADAVIADAYVKGLRDYNQEKALAAMVKDATTTASPDGIYKARVGISDYIKLGYVPTDKYKESAIRTMEFAYDDFCIAQVAKLMGEDSLYNVLMKRSKNYLNVLDPETKMVRGRNSDGSWRAADDPSISIWARGTEKDRDTYFRNITLFVPHDVDGLAEFMGGRKELEAYLDHFFSNDYYYVGDEFSMHSPYIYNLIGCPWKTQATMRKILDYYFVNEPWGLSGMDDCGQLSSWYLMGAMGFYSFCPGTPIYQLTSPVVDRASIKLANGKTFTIVAKGNSEKNVYIKSATLNGKPYNKCWIHHDDIMNGGTLEFTMSSKPNRKWGIEK